MTNTLKPCPFCGGEAVCVEVGIVWQTLCRECRAETAPYSGKPEAIQAWNNRAAYEAEDYFFLPKPKEKIIHVAPLGVEETENGYKGQFGIRVLEEAARRWANEMDDEIVRRISECWNAKNCDECERGAIPATEENMRELGEMPEKIKFTDVNGSEYMYALIVRCKDCKNFNAIKEECFAHWEEGITEGIAFSATPNDFCAWGERKVVD